VPKKAKEFIPLVAEELGMDKDLVDLIVSVYWKEVRKTLSELRENRVTILNFGTFVTKKPKLLELEKKYSFFVEERKDATTFRSYAMMKDTEATLHSIRKLLSKDQEEKLKRQTIINKRNVQSTKDNLEESQRDISGNKE